MMENLAGDEDDFPTERVAATRIANVANAYAWWVVKDSVAITILKVSRRVALSWYAQTSSHT